MSTQELSKLMSNEKTMQKAITDSTAICNVAEARSISLIQSMNRDLSRVERPTGVRVVSLAKGTK